MKRNSASKMKWNLNWKRTSPARCLLVVASILVVLILVVADAHLCSVNFGSRKPHIESCHGTKMSTALSLYSTKPDNFCALVLLKSCPGVPDMTKTYSTYLRFSRVRPHHQALRTNARGSDSNRAAHRAAWHRTQAGAQEQSVVEPPSPDGFQQLAAGGARVCAERWVLSPHILHAHHRHSSARVACPRCRRDSVSWVHPLPAVLEHCAPAEGDGTLCLDGVPARPARPARSCSRSRQERSSLDQLR